MREFLTIHAGETHEIDGGEYDAVTVYPSAILYVHGNLRCKLLTWYNGGMIFCDKHTVMVADEIHRGPHFIFC